MLALRATACHLHQHKWAEWPKMLVSTLQIITCRLRESCPAHSTSLQRDQLSKVIRCPRVLQPGSTHTIVLTIRPWKSLLRLASRTWSRAWTQIVTCTGRSLVSISSWIGSLLLRLASNSVMTLWAPSMTSQSLLAREQIGLRQAHATTTSIRARRTIASFLATNNLRKPS